MDAGRYDHVALDTPGDARDLQRSRQHATAAGAEGDEQFSDSYRANRRLPRSCVAGPHACREGKPEARHGDRPPPRSPRGSFERMAGEMAQRDARSAVGLGSGEIPSGRAGDSPLDQWRRHAHKPRKNSFLGRLAAAVTRMSPSTAALQLALIIVLSSLAVDGAKWVYDQIRYDHSKVFEIYEIEYLSTSLKPGEPFGYRLAEYYKREDCAPPQGRGELRYILHDYNVDRLPNGQPTRTWIDYGRDSRSGGGKGHRSLDDFSLIPLGPPYMAPLMPGSYALQWRATYHCANSSEPVVMMGPLMEFTVI